MLKFKSVYIIIVLMSVVASCNKKNTTPQAENEVWLMYKRFNPTSIKIKPGTTLTFINKDNANHTVTETGKAFASGKIKSGDQYQYTFNDSADHTIYCNYHPDNLQEQIYIAVRAK